MWELQMSFGSRKWVKHKRHFHQSSLFNSNISRSILKWNQSKTEKTAIDWKMFNMLFLKEFFHSTYNLYIVRKCAVWHVGFTWLRVVKMWNFRLEWANWLLAIGNLLHKIEKNLSNVSKSLYLDEMIDVRLKWNCWCGVLRCSEAETRSKTVCLCAFTSFICTVGCGYCRIKLSKT